MVMHAEPPSTIQTNALVQSAQNVAVRAGEFGEQCNSEKRFKPLQLLQTADTSRTRHLEAEEGVTMDSKRKNVKDLERLSVADDNASDTVWKPPGVIQPGHTDRSAEAVLHRQKVLQESPNEKLAKNDRGEKQESAVPQARKVNISQLLKGSRPPRQSTMNEMSSADVAISETRKTRGRKMQSGLEGSAGNCWSYIDIILLHAAFIPDSSIRSEHLLVCAAPHCRLSEMPVQFLYN